VTEFSPLLESSSSHLARDLLRSGLDDTPPPEARARVAAALGLTLSAVAIATPASAAALNGGAGIALGATGKASASSALVLGKWLFCGMLAGVLVSGTTTVRERVHAESARQARMAEHPAARMPVAARREKPRPSPATSLSEPSAERAPSGELRGSEMAPNAPSAQNGAPPALDAKVSRALGVEARRIDEARRALSRGDVRRALAELDGYDRSRVIGVLDREAEFLRIQALVQVGDAVRAVALARTYLSLHPRDAYAARLNELIDNAGAPPSAHRGINP
jgi:hypothetical protein